MFTKHTKSTSRKRTSTEYSDLDIPETTEKREKINNRKIIKISNVIVAQNDEVFISAPDPSLHEEHEIPDLPGKHAFSKSAVVSHQLDMQQNTCKDFFETGYCVSGGGAGAATVAFIRAKRAADAAGAPVWIAWGWRPSAAPAYSASTRGVRVVVGEDGATLAFAGACDVAAPGFAAGGCAFSLSPQNASRAANVTESDVYDSPSGFKCAATTTIAFHATFDAATGRQLWGRYNVALGAGAGHRTIASVVPAGIALSAAGDLYAAMVRPVVEQVAAN